MSEGILVYRCRRCGKLELPATGDVRGDIEAIVSGRKRDLLFDFHDCKDGAVGVTELIGGVPEKAPKK